MLARAPQIWLEKALAVAIAIFALLAVWSRWPYGTYTILRFALCVMSVYLAVRSYAVGQRAWVWIGGVTAALFNPFFPLHLQRSQWRILDFGAAFVLTLWAWKLRLPESEQQQPSQSSPSLQTTDLGQGNKMLTVADVASPSRKTRVLVCDDEPTIADFVADTLKDDDCETVVEYSGLDAVYRAATFRPDIAARSGRRDGRHTVPVGHELGLTAPQQIQWKAQIARRLHHRPDACALL